MLRYFALLAAAATVRAGHVGVLRASVQDPAVKDLPREAAGEGYVPGAPRRGTAGEGLDDEVTSSSGGGGESGPAGLNGRELSRVPVVGSAFVVEPVSTALKCVVTLAVQYMLVYTILAFFRTFADSFGDKFMGMPIREVLRTLQTATLTVNYAPMLAVLFLAVRMRVVYLTQGKGDPPEWMQMCMYMCTYAVLAMTLCVIIIPFFTGEASVLVDPKTGDITPDCEPFQHRGAAMCFTIFKYLIMIFLYGGVAAICFGLFTYEPPPGIWKETPPVSPAVYCVMMLSIMFFAVYAIIQISRSYTQITGNKNIMNFISSTRFEDVMLMATNAMNFAPMLAILFLAARMRALQMDPRNGDPQPWAQNCFYLCTYAVLAQTFLAIAVPLVLRWLGRPGETRSGGRVTEGDIQYHDMEDNPTLGLVLTAARYFIMLSIYSGVALVIYSIFTLQHPKGPQFTPPLSPTLQCVMILTVQFFLVYGLIWIGITLEDFMKGQWDLSLLHETMESATATIMFCPMLAILFVGTRMRALQISNNRGAPQGYVQDGMYCATWAVLLQFAMVVAVPICTGRSARMDDSGSVKWRPQHPIGLFIVTAVKWLGLALMYGGVLAVIVGIYTMTPQNTDGSGELPLVRQTPFGKSPPGLNDAEGLIRAR